METTTRLRLVAWFRASTARCDATSLPHGPACWGCAMRLCCWRSLGRDVQCGRGHLGPQHDVLHTQDFSAMSWRTTAGGSTCSTSPSAGWLGSVLTFRAPAVVCTTEVRGKKNKTMATHRSPMPMIVDTPDARRRHQGPNTSERNYTYEDGHAPPPGRVDCPLPSVGLDLGRRLSPEDVGSITGSL